MNKRNPTQRLLDLVREYNTQRRHFEAARKRMNERKEAFDDAAEALRVAILDASIDSVRVRGVNYTPSSRVIAEMYDPDAFFAYVAKHQAYELLYRRVTLEAARERWDAGETIDGVRPGKVPTLSVTKAAK